MDVSLDAQVRALVFGSRAGTLCTLAAQRGIDGFPFGSVVPVVTAADGRPLFLLANIASHTANLRKDPRASLMVRQPDVEGDPQTGWRVTVIGPLERLVREGEPEKPGDVVLPEEEWAELAARYRERVPGSTEYRRTHDFAFWRMREIVKVRYIGGFGIIHWLRSDAVLRDPLGEGLREAAPDAIAHLNEDHRHNLLEMCAGLYGFTPDDAEVVGLDRTGFQVVTRGPDDRLHFGFDREIRASELRQAVIDVLGRARDRAA